jgi:hypothetical protein
LEFTTPARSAVSGKRVVFVYNYHVDKSFNITHDLRNELKATNGDAHCPSTTSKFKLHSALSAGY